MNSPSLKQPPELMRANYIKMIEALMADGLESEARQVDAKFYVGYFAEKESPTNFYLDKFVTQHPQLIKLKERVRKIAPHDDSVIIYGETGTGKELIAHALHGRRKGEFIAINCAGLPEYLIESELFGHAKGAFTGADKETDGLFTLANNGTLFLDEIGELPLPLQAKLLRVLQDHKIRKVGGKEFIDTSARFVAATHRNLPQLIKEGKFRLDLYSRLKTFELQLLGLKDRVEDIPLIISKLDADYPKDKINWQQLLTHKLLEGNVRDLQSLVRQWQVEGTLPQQT